MGQQLTGTRQQDGSGRWPRTVSLGSGRQAKTPPGVLFCFWETSPLTAESSVLTQCLLEGADDKHIKSTVLIHVGEGNVPSSLKCPQLTSL